MLALPALTFLYLRFVGLRPTKPYGDQFVKSYFFIYVAASRRLPTTPRRRSRTLPRRDFTAYISLSARARRLTTSSERSSSATPQLNEIPTFSAPSLIQLSLARAESETVSGKMHTNSSPP